MAVDFAIRVIMDEGGAGGISADKIPEIVRRVIQVLEPETLALTHAQTTYTAGTKVYNAAISVGTVTVADYGIGIEVDSTVSADKKAEILRRVLQVLESESLSVATGVYAHNADSKNQIVLTVT